MNRSDYIGSYDAPYILNGDYGRLFAQKQPGYTKPEPTFSMLLGQVTEPLHLDWLTKSLNNDYTFSLSPGEGLQHFATFKPDSVSAEAPGILLGSHPDALGKHSSDFIFPVETKLTARFRTVEEAADFYMPQIQHHLLCWQAERLLFSVIIGTSEPVYAWIGVSTEWQEHYLERCATFWNILRSGNAPAPLMVDDMKPIVPKGIADSVPINEMVRRDMTGNNRWTAIRDEYIDTEAAAKKHEKAKKDLKALVDANVSMAYDDKIELKRDARGAIRITIKTD